MGEVRKTKAYKLFIKEYLKDNPSNSKTEAIQEWNKLEEEREILISRLPFDIKRELLYRIPGGRYSVLTTKQKDNIVQLKDILVDKEKLCSEPITVKEFKNYVLDIAIKVEKGLTCNRFEFTFISGYGMTIMDIIGTLFRRKSVFRELKIIAKTYNGDRRFPIVQNIIIKRPEDNEISEEENIDEYINIYTYFYGIILTRPAVYYDIEVRYGGMEYFQFHTEEMMDEFGLNKKENLVNTIKKILEEATYPDYPYIRTSPAVTRAIIERRSLSRNLDKQIIFEKVFKPLETYSNFIIPVPPLISIATKKYLIKAFMEEFGNDTKVMDISTNSNQDTMQNTQLLKDFFDKNKLRYIIN